MKFGGSLIQRSLNVILFLMCLSTFLFADLKTQMSQIPGIAAGGYLQPFASVIGAQANQGWFHQPPPAKMYGFNIEFGLTQAYSGYKVDSDEHFEAYGPFRFTREQANLLIPGDYTQTERLAIINAIVQQDFQVYVYGPTLYGEAYNPGSVLSSGSPGIQVQFTGQMIHAMIESEALDVFIPNNTIDLQVGGLQSNFMNLSKISTPLNMQEITIGTLVACQLTLRENSYIDDKVGKIQTIGFGIQHNPALWLPFKLPCDISLLYGYQTVEIADMVKNTCSSSGLALSITRGKNKKNFTLYSQLAYEQSQMKVNYYYQVATISGRDIQTQKIEFTLDGKNSLHWTIGGDVKFYFVNLRFEADLSRYSGRSGALSLYHIF
jgi:hypothetical protein